ncbi:MAG TPA: hypothetical protein VFD92_20620 [Candidatus Binatia bacterium]|nr:hypothetical protein [Candidatus Binatia bacterium]
MDRLAYTRDDLLAEHAYARPLEVDGVRLHGGFDATGTYRSPRTLHRWPAVRAWREQLARRGWPLLDADARLLKAGPYPSYEQQKLLLQRGLGQTFWNSLTITGVIEARGRLLVDLPAPDFARVIADDVSETATGHLNKGLLVAHGMDEGGDPATRLGAHDAMWFAVRDLVFGRDAYPIPEVPASIARPDAERLAPRIPLGHEQMLTLLMNVLMIEVRAEVGFDFTLRVLRDPGLFADRRDRAERAAEMVERIRIDEAIHVAYLQTVLSEMRSFTWRAVDGGDLPGSDVIDPMWSALVAWHAVENPRLQRPILRDAIHRRLLAQPAGADLVRAFDALETPLPD